ncbi:hypothetical protein KAFR_0C02600 [Kazachstania africana CBS 2517]|uniref:Uncharacterized protein n=1 Tax=Kazachstania africana (strain ATCC 22294 / BCRC 22015 / CBS 2517 / CECT 1963 / NBRC 1671 / NRRL Y-8276) TaxID=1071382 RepID=H2ASA3_KAZAF|nr:hypothetical protein KAFR_0C02600 [Kazachstania africana CBS 2517]CCF57253.1 hypothetical protein KAFR_0C02600 [Kazachstania africana CBS 2517]
MLGRSLTSKASILSKNVACARLFSVNATFLKTKGTKESSGGHKKEHQNAEEMKEQQLFDKNKENLEKMESDYKYSDFQKPTMEELKKKGDDARIEQNRPDDGVY